MRIKDIAKMANVSPSTVSIVLNNKNGVGDETRKRVASLLEQYGYKISENRNRGKSKTIRFLKYREYGVIVEDNQGFISSIMDAVEGECRRQGFNLVITTFTKSNASEVVSSINRNNTDGIILVGTEMSRDSFSYIKKDKIPLIVVDNQMCFEDVDCVLMDNVEIAFCAVKHLVDLGHKDIGYFHSDMVISNFKQRGEGYRKALDYFRLPYKHENTFMLTPTLKGAYDGMKAAIKKGVKFPSAIFADNDMVAIGAIKALREEGYSIPEDISIVGIDNIPYGMVCEPSLTTIGISREKIGTLAVQKLVEQMEKKPDCTVKTLVGGTLIKRASTTKAKV